MADEKGLSKLWHLIKPIKFGMLSTQSGSSIHSRPMALVQDGLDDGKIWFFTLDDSLKVFEIGQYREVGISFASPDENTYISISGTATLKKDADLINELWNPTIESYFPNGKSDQHVSLLEIDIDSADCWNTNENKMMQLYKLAKAYIKNEQPHIGENRAIH